MASERARLRLLRQVMKAGEGQPGDQISMDKAVLADLLEAGFGRLVDEKWYLERYPDVAEAIRKGAVASARAHYFGSGIFEGRVPYEIGIDSRSYLAKHRDVADAVRTGTYRSGRDHFLRLGFAEGRSFTLESGVSRSGRS